MFKAVRHSTSMATNRGRASEKEVMGGDRGIVCVLPDLEAMVREEREMSRRVGEEDSLGVRWL